MARIGIVIVIGAIIGSMILANYMYFQYTTNFVEAKVGDTVTVGPVEYVVTFEGTHEGDKDIRPENTFVKIGITAKNIGDDTTVFSGGQIYIIDKKQQKHPPVYGEFSSKDLLLVILEPSDIVERTTQFDIPFDEEAQYDIIIRPNKEQSTVDTARICITNCG